MSKETTDLLQGTLDMLILKALQLGSMHGFGISVLIRRCLKKFSKWTKALCIQPFTGWRIRDGLNRSVALLLIFVAVLASAIPARRAVKVDPMVALRYE